MTIEEMVAFVRLLNQKDTMMHFEPHGLNVGGHAASGEAAAE